MWRKIETRLETTGSSAGACHALASLYSLESGDLVLTLIIDHNAIARSSFEAVKGRRISIP